MKVLVKAKYITYAMVEVDAQNADEANMKLDTLAKCCPTEFLDTHRIAPFRKCCKSSILNMEGFVLTLPTVWNTFGGLEHYVDIVFLYITYIFIYIYFLYNYYNYSK